MTNDEARMYRNPRPAGIIPTLTTLTPHSLSETKPYLTYLFSSEKCVQLLSWRGLNTEHFTIKQST